MNAWAEDGSTESISRARSVSLAVLDLLTGPLRWGVGLGRGYVDFGGYVLALTRAGGPRMPNGIECGSRFHAGAGQKVRAGQGELKSTGQRLILGPGWDPVPRLSSPAPIGRPMRLDPDGLAGRGPGLTPAGDDILIGYVAALGLLHGDWPRARMIAERAAHRTTSLSATLLRHAARGELPEPAHAFLELGDPAPLRAFGHSSGRCLILGLSLGAGRVMPHGAEEVGAGDGNRTDRGDPERCPRQP